MAPQVLHTSQPRTLPSCFPRSKNEFVLVGSAASNWNIDYVLSIVFDLVHIAGEQTVQIPRARGQFRSDQPLELLYVRIPGSARNASPSRQECYEQISAVLKETFHALPRETA